MGSSTTSSPHLNTAHVTPTISLSSTLKALSGSLEGEEVASCSGELKNVPDEDLALFFRNKKKNVTSCIDLPGSIGELNTLHSVSEPVMFSRGNQNSIDSKPSAKLDIGNFSINFSPEKLGILQAIHHTLFHADDGEHGLRAELCGLNVCTEGGFLKAYKGKRAGEDKIGLLVVVLPTTHEGGALIIQNGDDTIMHDLSGNDSKKTVRWVAILSNTEHQVREITSGHRLTLTYNLFTVDPVPTIALYTKEIQLHPFYQKLSQCVRDPGFLPKGGILGFGLEHEYLILTSTRDPCPPSELTPYLKSMDHLLFTTGVSLGLETNLEVVWELGYEGPILTLLTRTLSPYSRFERMEDLGDLLNAVKQSGFCEVMDKSAFISDNLFLRDIEVTEVHWVIPKNDTNEAAAGYIFSSGNHEMRYSYGNMVLTMRVPRWSQSEGKRAPEYGNDEEDIRVMLE